MLTGYRLDGMKVAILAADGFEQLELTSPRQALENAGAKTYIISQKWGAIQGMTGYFQASINPTSISVDHAFAQVNPDDFDALILPGGEISASILSEIPQALNFIRRIDQLSRPVAAICWAPLLLNCAGLVVGRTVTSHPILREELRKAGARWLDLPVVHDRNWLSSRGSRDLPIFNKTMVMHFREFWTERQFQVA